MAHTTDPPTTSRLTPAPAAEQLSERMLAEDGPVRVVLSETLAAAKQGSTSESGRTVCGRSGLVLKPKQRGEASVVLASCPRERGGTVHTHVTEEQLTNPVNSLPDMANVAFGLTDVSVVAGVDTTEVLVAAQDREEMAHALSEAVGVDTASPGAVVDAVRQRRVNPVAARERAREALAPLLRRVETDYPELRREMREVDLPDVARGDESVEMAEAFTFMEAASIPTTSFGAAARSVQHGFDAAGAELGMVTDRLGIKQSALSTGVGVVVGELVSRMIFE